MKTKLIDVVDPDSVALRFKSDQGQQVIKQCFNDKPSIRGEFLIKIFRKLRIFL